MNNGLIIDIGMHRGEDTEFYLSRGYKVVGVEANPLLIPVLKSKFSDAISSGNLVIIDKAVAERSGEVDFYINDHLSVWGSIDLAFIERNARSGKKASKIVKVASTTLKDIVSEFPDAYYIKIDVEGMDLACLHSLSGSVCRPRYLSIESSVSSPINKWHEELMLFCSMGYDYFKFIDQTRIHRLNGKTLDSEGKPTVYQYTPDSSGPFGQETPGEWMSLDRAIERARQLRADFESFSQNAKVPRHILRLQRFLRRLKGRPVSKGWFDLHAWRST